MTAPPLKARSEVAPGAPLEFSLVGGPLHRLGRRLGLVRGTDTVLIGVAVGAALWVVILGLCVMDGVTGRLFAWDVIGVHARLLVVLPLFFMCESWVNPRMTAMVHTLTATGVVPSSAHDTLSGIIARITRWKDAWLPEALCLAAAVLLAFTGSTLNFGSSGGYDPARTTLAAFVYYRVALTAFRFVVFLGIWKLALWIWFLWRLSRLDLRLLAGHPDYDGGLGPVQGVTERFSPLVAAISVLESASLAEAISTGSVAITAVYPKLALLLLVDAALFLGPLLVFTDKMWAGRTKGSGAYSRLAAYCVAEFEAKWIDGDDPKGSRLSTQDFSALTDLSSVTSIARGMRWIPVSPKGLTMLTLAAIAPLTPLALFKYPLAELATKLFKDLIGL